MGGLGIGIKIASRVVYDIGVITILVFFFLFLLQWKKVGGREAVAGNIYEEH